MLEHSSKCSVSLAALIITSGFLRKKEEENNVIDYSEAVKIAYTESEHMQRYLNTAIKVVTEINKTFNRYGDLHTKQ